MRPLDEILHEEMTAHAEGRASNLSTEERRLLDWDPGETAAASAEFIEHLQRIAELRARVARGERLTAREAAELERRLAAAGTIRQRHKNHPSAELGRQALPYLTAGRSQQGASGDIREAVIGAMPLAVMQVLTVLAALREAVLEGNEIGVEQVRQLLSAALRERRVIEKGRPVQTEGHDVADQASVLLGDLHAAAGLVWPDIDSLPRMITYDAAVVSVGEFVRRRYPLPHRGTGSARKMVWPLPGGEAALVDYALRHGFVRAELPPALIASRPDARIGLVIEVQAEYGLVRLFGLFAEDDESPEGWSFGDRVITTEKMGGGIDTAGGIDRMQRELERWYDRVVRGIQVPAGGRPRGPSVDDWDTLQRRYDEVLRDLRRRGMRITAAAVATELGHVLGRYVARSSLQDWIRNGYLPPLPKR